MTVHTSAVQMDREALLKELTAGFATTSRAGGRAYLLSGPPGVGKSYIARRFINALPATTPCLLATTPPTGTPPLFPICAALTSTTSLRISRQLRAVAKQYGEAVPVLREVVGPLLRAKTETEFGPRDLTPPETFTFHALTDFLRRLTANRPGVLFLDDIQWIDASSLKFVGHLTGVLSSFKLLLLLTSRSNGEENAIVQDLRQTLSRLPEDRSRQLSMPPITNLEVAEVAGQVLGGQVLLNKKNLTWMLRMSSGNPQHLRGLLLYLRENGHIIHSHGSWRITSYPAEPFVPESILNLITSRLRAVVQHEEDADLLLQLAAVVGNTFDARIVAKAAELQPQGIANKLGRIADRSGLIRRIGFSADFAFDHELSREAILLTLGPLARELYLKVGAVLAADPTVPPVRLAWIFRSGGDPERAASFFSHAASVALESRTYSEAAALALEQDKLLAQVNQPISAPARLQAAELHALALFRAEDNTTAAGFLRERFAKDEGAKTIEALRIFGLAGGRLATDEAHREALAALKQAVDLASDPGKQAELWADLVYAYDTVGDYANSAAAWRTAVRKAHDASSPGLLARLYRMSCIFFEPEKVLDYLRKALDLADEAGLPAERSYCLNNAGTAWLRLKELPRASEAFKRSVHTLDSLGGFRRGIPINNLGLLALLSSSDAAQALFDEALQSSLDDLSKIFVRSNLAICLFERGERRRAEELLIQGVQDADAAGDAYYRGCLRHNLAFLLLRTERPEDALRVIADCPVHYVAADQELVLAMRATLLLEAKRAIGDQNIGEQIMADAGLLGRSTKRQAWLYRSGWYYCDIEFWED